LSPDSDQIVLQGHMTQCGDMREDMHLISARVNLIDLVAEIPVQNS
jgi:hypothetical protein